MNNEIQVITTTPNRDVAIAIAQALVEARLAACVQVAGPIESIYRWQGRTEHAAEWRCDIKSRQALYRRIEETIRRLHPYEVPEILALPIVAGSADYCKWLNDETSSGESTLPTLP